MSELLLDTNVIIDLIVGDRVPKERFDALQKKGDCLLNPIVLCELYKGAFLSKDPQQNIEKIDQVISDLEVIDIDVGMCKRYGSNFAHLQRIGRPVSDFDLIIGSMAQSRNAILLTRNIKDFKNIEGLQVEEW